MDSNGDEVADRIYFGDTGGNLWRVDMPGDSLPTSSQDTWRIVQLGDFNGGTAATDRRFFNAPDIVRASYGGLSYDAISIGTGDRTNPNATDNDDQFYMIRDEQVAPYFTPAPSADDCSDPDPVDDFRCDLPLGPGDLYDATANLIQDGSTIQREAAATALAAAKGWRLDLANNGEKSLAKSITIDGKIYFTTFSPDPSLNNVCEPSPGTGRLYAVKLGTAGEVVDFDQDGNKDRSWVIGSLIPDTPSPHFGSDGVVRLLMPPGSSAGVGNPFNTGATFRDPFGNYWYREQY
jgi:type IV pilus assembly protein PilY1